MPLQRLFFLVGSSVPSIHEMNVRCAAYRAPSSPPSTPPPCGPAPLGQAVNFVRRRLVDHGDVQRASQELVDKALSLATNDNVSALVIALNQVFAV